MTIRTETEAKLHIQTAIRAGEYALGWSQFLDFENAANPLAERRSEIQKWESLADAFVVETPAILTTMNALCAIGLKPLKALHLACAMALHCDYFLTVDKGILKRESTIAGTRVMNPLDFVVEQGLR